MSDETVELTDALDIEIAVDKYLKEIGIDFMYNQMPSGLDSDDLRRVVLPNLKYPYKPDEEKGMPIKFKIQFLRKGNVVFESDFSQGIGHAPKSMLNGGFNREKLRTFEGKKRFEDLLAWINRGKQGGRDLDKLTGFRFVHDFLYVSDFERVAQGSNRRDMSAIASIATLRGVKNARNRMSLNGYGEGTSAAGVLSCLLGDALASEQTFEDWASDFGYDSDSRKAESIYRACDEIGKKLRSVFGHDRMEHLRTLTQNY